MSVVPIDGMRVFWFIQYRSKEKPLLLEEVEAVSIEEAGTKFQQKTGKDPWKTKDIACTTPEWSRKECYERKD